MRLMDADYRIAEIPTGWLALQKIEAMGRIAYKSEGKITNGVPCKCNRGYEVVDGGERQCSVCKGTGWAVEPSSYRFVRKLLKAEAKAELIARLLRSKVVTQLDQSGELVQEVLDYLRDNPAHESVIEHCSATVVFTTNRGVTHELVRHRLASYTQESTRYCNYSKDSFGNHVSVIDRKYWGEGVSKEQIERARRYWERANETSEQCYLGMVEECGISPQIARDVLLHCTKADIAMTANFREWRTVFRQRPSHLAHPDMRGLMRPLLADFQRLIPIVFDDITYRP